MNMKTALILSLVLLWCVFAQAETRTIGVRVTRDADSKAHVSITSDVEKEKKKDISVEQAAAVLQEAQGWGSSVWVGIVAHGVPLRDYLLLLKAIADNVWLELVFIDGQKPAFIGENIRKNIENNGTESLRLVADPVAAITKVLPKTWAVLKVEEHTYPSYRPKGDGKAVFLGISGKLYSKQGYSAVLNIMPASYEDGGKDPTNGGAQTMPARLVATTADAKLYLWPGPEAEDWTTMQEDLLKTLVKTGESSNSTNGAPPRH
jgi:hypothetical protein